MRTEARQAFSGILLALLSIFLIFGSILLSLVETGVPIVQAPDATATFNLEEIPTLPYKLLPGEITLTALAGKPTASPTATPGEIISCNIPAGWVPVMIQLEDTLQSLAQTYGISEEALREGNCLSTDSLVPGKIYVPAPAATDTPIRILPPTSTPVPCGPPIGWVIYIVRSGDTLFALGQVLHVGVPDLQRANCMGTSIIIRTGQRLYVPFIPVYTPVPTATWPPYQTPTPTWPPYPTPTNTMTQTPTASPTSTSTHTSTPFASTPTPTNTATQTPPATPTATSTLLPSSTPTLPPASTPSLFPAIPPSGTPEGGTPEGGDSD